MTSIDFTYKLVYPSTTITSYIVSVVLLLCILTFAGVPNIFESHIKKVFGKLFSARRLIPHKRWSGPNVHIYIAYRFNGNLVSVIVNWFIYFVQWIFTWLCSSWRIRDQDNGWGRCISRYSSRYSSSSSNWRETGA